MDDPPWWSEEYDFRIRLNQEGLADRRTIVSRSADFTPVLKFRNGRTEDEDVSPVDLSSLCIVRYTRIGDETVAKPASRGPRVFIPSGTDWAEEGIGGQPCPTTFVPDARFDAESYLVGRVVWCAPAAKAEESWWVYGKLGQPQLEQRSGACSAGVEPFTVEVNSAAATASLIAPRVVRNTFLYDDYGHLLGASNRQEMSVGKLDPLRRYFPVGQTAGSATLLGPWFGVETIDKGVGLQVQIPDEGPSVWNYQRGQAIRGSVNITNEGATEFTGQLKVALGDEKGNWVEQNYPLDITAEAATEIGFQVPTTPVACGDYELRFAISDGATTYAATAADVLVAPARDPQIVLGPYGWPHRDRLQQLRWARIMAHHNMTGCFAGGGYASLDEATALGMKCYIRDGLYPKGPTRVQSWDGTEVQQSFAGYCPNDPEYLPKLATRIAARYTNYSRYASFGGISCFDDYSYKLVKRDDKWQWTCYCPHCRQRYRDKYGSGPPNLDEMRWESAVVPDDDPALRFILEKCRILRDYVATYERAKDSFDPSLEIGQTVIRNTFPAVGLWPPFQFGSASVTSMYDYPSCSAIMLNYFTLYEFNQMGNRGKKSWMLAEGMDVSREFRFGEHDTPLPAWTLRSEFWHLLAAGYKTVGLFGLDRAILKDRAFDEELSRVGRIAQRIGPLMGSIQPKRTGVAIFASLPDFVQPDAPTCWPGGRGRIYSLHKQMLTAGVPCEIVSDDEAAQGYLSHYTAVVVPPIEYIRQSAREALVEYAKEGGQVLVDERSRIDLPGATRLPHERLVVEGAVYSDYLPLNVNSPNVVFREFAVPSGALFVLVNCQPEVSGQFNKYRWGQLSLVQPQPVDCNLKLARQDLVCYDLLSGQLLEQDKAGIVPVSLAPADGLIIACYEHPLERITLGTVQRSVRRGETFRLRATVQAGGERSQALHLLDVSVTQPDGTPNAEHSRVVLAREGRASLALPVAVNDQPGTWQVSVTEMASQQGAEVTFEVK